MKKEFAGQIESVLKDYGILCASKGINANLDTYKRNKASLISILRKHPMWNEEHSAIITDIYVDVDMDNETINEQKLKLIRLCSEQICTGTTRIEFELAVSAILEAPKSELPVNEETLKRYAI